MGTTVFSLRSERCWAQVCGIATASNNRLEQDHRSVKGRYGPRRGFKCPQSAGEFCRAYDELRNFLRSHSRANQQVSAKYRRFHFLRCTATVLNVLKAA